MVVHALDVHRQLFDAQSVQRGGPSCQAPHGDHAAAAGVAVATWGGMGKRSDRRKKLVVRRETIRRLDSLTDRQLRGVVGGVEIVEVLSERPVDVGPIGAAHTTRGNPIGPDARYC